MTKELIEEIKIRYGWTDEAILSIVPEDLVNMTKEELSDFIKVSTFIYNSTEEENFDIKEIPVVDGIIQVSSEGDM